MQVPTATRTLSLAGWVSPSFALKVSSNTDSNSNLALVDLPAGSPAGRSLVCKVVQTDNTIDGGTAYHVGDQVRVPVVGQRSF